MTPQIKNVQGFAQKEICSFSLDFFFNKNTYKQLFMKHIFFFYFLHLTDLFFKLREK